jgi:hypothetical protein
MAATSARPFGIWRPRADPGGRAGAGGATPSLSRRALTTHWAAAVAPTGWRNEARLEEPELLSAGGSFGEGFPPRRPPGAGASNLEPIDRKAASQTPAVGDGDAAVSLSVRRCSRLPPTRRPGPPSDRFARAQAQYGQSVRARSVGPSA